MNRLFLFNPENDIALGQGCGKFTPPRQAALLHKAGAMIPFWLGDSDDYVLVDEKDLETARRWHEQMRVYGIEGPTPVSKCPAIPSLSLAPWGWSLDAMAQFRRCGAGDYSLPFNLDTVRELSHRRTAVRILQLWHDLEHPTDFILPIEARSIADIESFLTQTPEIMVKLPWSSSGRGVFKMNVESLQKNYKNVEGMIRKQGSVIVEPYLDRVTDFAMLFHYSGGNALFSGYSLFFNSTDTNYGGNVVASDNDILRKLSEYVSPEKIVAVKDTTIRFLEKTIGERYEGPLGVDMMIYRAADSQLCINPCIEVNLRYTMGFVAKGLYKKLQQTGVMSIAPAWSRNKENDGQESFGFLPVNDCFDFVFRPD